VKTPTTAIKPTTSTPVTRKVQGQVNAHPDQSGFRLLVTGPNALMSRIVLADKAQHSIDLQYYIFFGDATGRLVAQHILSAADRGVRVRLLLDDIDIVKEDKLLDALDAHPNIEVRLFNPFRFRQRSLLAKAAQALIEGQRLNRRMHNKSYIVDGAQAIIGGRNIGDAYFDLGDDAYFRDLDALAIGPIVSEIAASFDSYWNSDSAFPVKAYSGHDANAANLADERAELLKNAREFDQSAYADALAEELPNGPSADQGGRWFWGDARLVVDSPAKADPDKDGQHVDIGRQISPTFMAAKQQVLLISPYFIPGDTGMAALAALRKRDVEIKVLTNALAATDEPAVHAGYARYRRDLLELEVGLYEFRPIAGEKADAVRGSSSGVSLHAKAMVVDHRNVFIGSMNFDPRSRYLNTELGVIVDSPPFAASIEKFFADATTPKNSFHVVLGPARSNSSWRPVSWVGTLNGERVEYSHDPFTSWWKRTQVQLIRVLPIESLL
ncbi:MAG: phospholipase D family protein, partial [Dokdonella sp.]